MRRYALDPIRLGIAAVVALVALACSVLASFDGPALPVGAVFLLLVIAAGLSRVYRHGDLAMAGLGVVAYGVLESSRAGDGIHTWFLAALFFAVAVGLTRVLEGALRGEETRRRQMLSVVDELTMYDDSSGLMKRRYGELALEDEVRRSRRTGAPTTIVVVAPDAVPDHPVEEPPDPEEEAALIGGVFRDLLRATDRNARLADSTFLAILPATDAVGGGVVATKICRTAQERGGRPLRCGIASFPDNAVSTADLLEEALAALYLARSGNLTMASPEMLLPGELTG